MNALSAAARQGAFQSLQLTAELVRIVHEFRRCKIDSIPVKGPSLAALVYGELSLRLYSDLDILVHEQDVPAAKSALEELGYTPVASVFNDSRDSLIPSSLQQPFVHGDSKAICELHWSLSHQTLTNDLLERQWWDSRQPVDVGGTAISTLGPESLILYLCIHGAKHSWGRIGWLSDLLRSLKRFEDANWDTIWGIARSHGATRMVSVALILIQDMLDGTSLVERPFAGHQPDAEARSLAALIRSRLLRSHEPVDTLDFAVQLRFRSRWSDRSRYAMHILLEPWPADIAALKLPPAFRGLYYFFRPLRLAWTRIFARRRVACV